MVLLAQRKLIQALPNLPTEVTSTFSSVTDDGHYISLRPLVDPTGQEEFPFEWAFGGTSKSCEVNQLDSKTVQNIYNLEFDSNIIRKVEVCHKGPTDTRWETWPDGQLFETGEIYPFGRNREGVKFRELWQPLDPNTYLNEEQFYPLPRKAVAMKAASIAFSVDNKEYLGLVTVVGNFVQGYLHKKDTESASFIRAGLNDDGYEYSVKFGDDVEKFPTEFHKGLKKGDKVGIFEVIET